MSTDITVTVESATVDATLTFAASSGSSGDVVGPASAIDENIAVFDSTTGKLIKDSGTNISDVTANTASRHDPVTVADSDNVDLTLTGQQVSADLTQTTVTAGSYTSTDLTVDAYGRITAASNGSGGGGSDIDWSLYYWGFSGGITDGGIQVTSGAGSSINLTKISNVSVMQLRATQSSDETQYWGYPYPNNSSTVYGFDPLGSIFEIWFNLSIALGTTTDPWFLGFGNGQSQANYDVNGSPFFGWEITAGATYLTIKGRVGDNVTTASSDFTSTIGNIARLTNAEILRIKYTPTEIFFYWGATLAGSITSNIPTLAMITNPRYILGCKRTGGSTSTYDINLHNVYLKAKLA